MRTNHFYRGAPWRALCLILGLTVISAGHVTAQIFTNLHNFTFSGSDGGNPLAGVILSGTNLYGTASTGGTGNSGIFAGTGEVFGIGTNGAGLAGLHGFPTMRASGAVPKAGVILSGGTLYGTTSAGGTAGNGVVFSVGTNASLFTNFYNFSATSGPASTNSDGAEPVAALILSGTNLYGTAQNGGASGNGTIFAVNTNGTVFTNLHSFTATNNAGTNGDGANPVAGLVLSGTSLYGTAKTGGSFGFGTIFSINTNGAAFTNLHSFTGGSGGSEPAAELILIGNTLYGTTISGGSAGNGTVFSINTNGTGFTTVHSFAALNNQTNSDGAAPYASLISSGNILYGTTTAGGSGGEGTVFQVNANGSDFLTLHGFTATNSAGTNSDGAIPYGGLILSGDILYGTTSAGGATASDTGYGTIFSILAPPQLAITPSGTNVVLTWTNPAPGLVLQSTTNLQAAIWNTNLPAPVVINGQNTVTNASSGPRQFYRLGE